MLGPIGANLMSILGVLSPDKIDNYIDVEEEQSQRITALAAGAEDLSLGGRSSDKQFKKHKHTNPKEPEEAGQAKIIPLHSYKDDKEIFQEHNEEKEPLLEDELHKGRLRQTKRVTLGEEADELESIGVFSADKIQEFENRRLEKEKKGRESTTVFILNQREKFKSSKRKMIERTALKNYQSSAAQELMTIDDSEEDLESNKKKEVKSNLSAGVLLNKKHY